jgi:dienelactone hydrolase
MKAHVSIAVLLSLAGFSLAQEKPPQVPPALAEAATKYLDLAIRGDFAEASKNYDETMTKVFPPDKLQATWKSLTTQFGPLRSRGEMRLEKRGAFDAVIVPCTFDKMELNARVVFDSKARIAGLNFMPAKDPAADWKTPEYSKAELYVERQTKVGSGEWELPATLTLPKGDGPFPALVLVHGSGSHDRDETIGPNKPFKDLALGLASRGVAVLRYVKRTKQYGEKVAKTKDKLTVKEEVTDDAVAAVDLLRHTEQIDPKRIFVLGHSLGGMMAPSIGKADPRIAGLISLAGTSRPLDEVIVDQTSHILAISPNLPEEQKKLLTDLQQKSVDLMKQDLSKEVPGDKLPLGMPVSYWRSVKEIDPPAIAKQLPMPILILQGGSDYQVTKKDFDRWKSVLGERKGVESKWYPGLGHLFIKVDGEGKPSDYEKAGHISAEVVEDIAKWITRN